MVDVQVNKEVIEISAERKREGAAKDRDYLHRERAYSVLQRTITFPEEIVPEKVEGTMENGILQLAVPKKEPGPEERMRKIQLK